MNDMTPMGIGHNGGPDPLDAAIATDPEALELAEGILTGAPVTSEAQMKQVDEVANRLKALKKAVSEAEESEAKPIYDQWKSAKARFKPTLDDLDVQIKGCASMVDAFKRKLAAEKAEAERIARAEANRKMREAEEAARQANAADLDAQREAAEAKRQADEAVAAARAASKDTVKGMRTVTRTVVLDEVGLARALWAQDREAQLAFQADRARKLKLHIPGVVEQRQEKEAY